MFTFTISKAALWILAAIATLITAAAITSCAKFNEHFQDAKVVGRNFNGAVVGNMPDGFSNWATKCADPGHRIYVAYHGDNAYAALAVVDDPNCR